LVDSRSQAKRLIQQGGVRINDEKVTSPDVDVTFAAPVLVQVGKRSFVELV
jgi:tyrosyl-tRNA synthetase